MPILEFFQFMCLTSLYYFLILSLKILGRLIFDFLQTRFMSVHSVCSRCDTNKYPKKGAVCIQ